MNYVSVDVLRSAAAEAEALERKGGRVSCDWRPDRGTPPCSNRVEYLVADATCATGAGDIERAPQWRCSEHLELELGEPPREQPIFQRIESPEPPE